MPVPSAATFARLADLIAIPDAADRPTRSVVEAFTGKELATVPVGTAQDAKDAIARAGWRRRNGPSVPSPSEPRSSTGTATWSSRTATP